MTSDSIPLHRRYPALAVHAPRVPIGEFPTRVERHTLAGHTFWVKRDDDASTDHGGNKVRKLEFLLPALYRNGVAPAAVVGYGATGSNWVRAAAHFFKGAGIPFHAWMFERPLSAHGERAMADTRAAATDVLITRSPAGLLLRAQSLPRGAVILPPGGSNTRSCLGYVNAALEVAEQITAGLLPCPRTIVVGLGTGGTAAGILAGLRLAGLNDVTVVGVRVADLLVSNTISVEIQARLLVSRVFRAARPHRLGRVRFQTDHRWIGRGYAIPFADWETRLAPLIDATGLHFDPSYTAKAALGLLAALEQPPASPVLYWHTLARAARPSSSVSSVTSVPATERA
jgi:D-cysteine desulfhydrase